MTEKERLAKQIGDFFGKYFKEDGRYCIDNGDTVYRYETVDALLADWVATLVENQKSTQGDSSGNWEKEVQFIYGNVIGLQHEESCLG